MRNYVIINGVNSNTINGLAINELPPITKPPMRVLQEEIDGRDGDITTNLGYGAYDKVMTIGLFHTFDINQIIAFFNGSGTIVFSNEPDKKYNYKIIDQIDYEKLISFKTATVTFHCQPFKYPVEETPLIIEPTIDTLENVTSASIETNESILSTTLKGNTDQYTTTGANVLESIATSNTTNIYEDVLWAEGLQANTTYTFQFVGVVGNRISGNANLFTTDTYHNITSGINTMTLKTKSDISTSTGSQYTSGKGWRIFKNAKSDNVTNVFTNVMANVGSTALPYEPYTNGASPNPTYPQPVNVVTGDNEVVVCGKNLFNKDTQDFQSGYYLDNNGAKQISANWGIYNIQVIPNTEYTISGATRNDGAYFWWLDKNNTPISLISSHRDITATSPNNAKYIALSIVWNTSSSAYDSDTFMLEASSTATTYEPYQSQTYPIYLGVENLFDGVFRQGTHVNTSTANCLCSTNEMKSVSGKQYTFYTNLPNTFKYKIMNCTANGTSTTVINDTSYSTSGSVSVNCTANGYLKILVKENDDSNLTPSTIAGYTFQVGIGTNHISNQPIELCKTENEQDYIYKYSDKWYWHKETRKVVLDGNENWLLNSSSGDSYRYWIKNDDFTNTFTNCLIGNEGVLLNKLFNDHFTQSLFSNTAIGKFSINNDSGSRWFLLNVDITTVENFKTWLSNNNVVVIYPLATPTNTEITDTELIGQLESLMSATTYYGITNINQQNNDLPFIMDLSYMEKDTDKVIVDNIGNIYSKPTIALEGNGTGGIYLNDNQILSVELTDKMTISISDMEAFDPDTHALLNRYVTGNYNSMTLQPNENTIKITGGITKATITDYTRWL